MDASLVALAASRLAPAEMLAHPNILGVPVAVIASFVLGGLWYSPLLFARAWKARAVVGGAALGSMRRGMIVSILMLGAMTISLFLLASRLPFEAVDGLLLGIAVGLVFNGGALAMAYAYTGRSLVLWLIDTGYQCASLALIGAIICGWRG